MERELARIYQPLAARRPGTGLGPAAAPAAEKRDLQDRGPPGQQASPAGMLRDNFIASAGTYERVQGITCEHQARRWTSWLGHCGCH